MASRGFRPAHRSIRPTWLTGRARIGRPSRNRRRSSASPAADSYRLPGSFSRHFRQTVSRSRETSGRSLVGGTASVVAASRIVSSAEWPRNGGRPVSDW